jgi:hypothetical protein
MFGAVRRLGDWRVLEVEDVVLLLFVEFGETLCVEVGAVTSSWCEVLGRTVWPVPL